MVRFAPLHSTTDLETLTPALVAVVAALELLLVGVGHAAVAALALVVALRLSASPGPHDAVVALAVDAGVGAAAVLAHAQNLSVPVRLPLVVARSWIRCSRFSLLLSLGSSLTYSLSCKRWACSCTGTASSASSGSCGPSPTSACT